MRSGLRILVDAYWWSAGPPSGRNVVRSFVRTWTELHPEDTLVLEVRPGHVDQVRRDLGSQGIGAEVRGAPAWARVHALAALTLGSRSTGFDAVFTQNFAALSLRACSAVFVHDAMFAEHPEWFGARERGYLALLRPSLRRAQVVLTSSHTEAARIQRVWPETRGRVLAVGLNPPRDFADAKDVRPAAADGHPYVLAVGRINVRKNLRRLVEAFLRDPLPADHHLYIVGRPDGLAEIIPEGDERIVVLDDVDDAQLRWLYRHAEVFAFPSLDEGFGLPLVEARSLGARAIVSDIPVFRELDIAEDYFDPTSVDDIVRALAATRIRPETPAPEWQGSWAETVNATRAALVGTCANGGHRVAVA
ncbi:glycosyltransferase family 1 protein [Homoserinibacter sp. GY 40078]|uniref:glycosyltransferase family 4 protein n=1 Tax=Homoserinibacter sp. GY 40078 TaxID=2603275 RepID=UPI0011CBA68D|nr:glycosyltransferase family 1 protein [Homoserinibacter sp. GY 40078]TXK17729.1 glycosyltransferase family 4 protein [Homoserinibacter sp. GY 40078]